MKIIPRHSTHMNPNSIYRVNEQNEEAYFSIFFLFYPNLPVNLLNTTRNYKKKIDCARVIGISYLWNLASKDMNLWNRF